MKGLLLADPATKVLLLYAIFFETQTRAAGLVHRTAEAFTPEAALVSALPGALEKMLSGRPVRSAPRARDGQPVPRRASGSLAATSISVQT